MNPQRWQKVEEVFQTVVELQPEEREAFLTQFCGDDDELRTEVQSLLEHEIEEGFFESAVEGGARAFAKSTVEQLIGQRIGAYRITGLVGQGGMGAVYSAVRDDDQYQQKVAIKIVKRGMDTSTVLRRFWRERQILASLNHPHIARLLDGGTTSDGLPYFVMEFIEGQPITDYCEANQTSIQERLKLFRQVCAAVRFAHQNLVVHRDIKPGNILVTKNGEPKLLDFGIAKLISPETSQAATRTVTSLRMMTPDYASPEQVRGLPITTAADIYSLGTVLYELLTGQRAHRFKTYSPLDIEQTICNTETEKPSEAAANAPGAPSRWRKHLAGDLDNIVMMALRKEPERRYRSVEQFSEDIRRHQEGLPVIARQDTLVYRAGKFTQRHKWGLATTVVVMLSLVGGIIASVYQTRRAERRFQQVRKLANTFLFDFHEKIRDLPGSTEAREMVVKTALEYLDSLAAETNGDATLERELAIAYQKVGDVQGDPWASNLGHTEAAMRSYQKGLYLAQNLAARDGVDLELRRTLAAGYFKLGALQSESGDKINANATLLRGVGQAEPLAQQTGDINDLILVENLYTRLGDTQLDTGDAPNALQSYRQALELARRQATIQQTDSVQISISRGYSHIGEALAAMGDLSGALNNYSQATLIAQALVKKHPLNQVYLRSLRVNYSWLGRLSWSAQHINYGDAAAAAEYHRKALLISERQVAADPQNARARQDLAIDAVDLAGVLVRTDPVQAAELYRKAHSATRALLASSPNEFMYLRRETDQLRGLAEALRRQGDLQGALRHLQQSLAQSRALHARDSTNTIVQSDLQATLLALGGLFLEMGDSPGSLEHYRQALTMAEAVGQMAETNIYARWRIADAYAGLGKYHAAIASVSTISTAERVANWREACIWYQKSFDVWDNWSKKAVSNVFNNARRDQAARLMAECNAALAKLGAG